MKDRKRLSTFQREILLFTLQIEGIGENTDESDNNRSFFIQMLGTFWRKEPAYTEAGSEVLQKWLLLLFQPDKYAHWQGKKSEQEKNGIA